MMFLTERLFAVAQALDASMLQLVEDLFLRLRWLPWKPYELVEVIGLQ